MKLININSVGNIGREFDQDTHMFLAHLVLGNETYARVARKCKGYKILDNSLIECGNAMTIEKVLHAAVQIQADEIILPDVFRDGPKTLDAVNKALDFVLGSVAQRDILGVAGMSTPKLMAVVQGKNYSEWWQCFDSLNRIDDIQVLGIPKVCAKLHPEGRRKFIPGETQTSKELHLLGLWYSFGELQQISDRSLLRIRSCDTVLPSYLAMHGLDWHGVRPDGYTVNLTTDVVSPHEVSAILSSVDMAFGDTLEV